MYITSHCRTNPIDFVEFWMHNYFYVSPKTNSYTLRPMESNSLKGSGDQMVFQIVFKFGMDIISDHPTYCINFYEYMINCFLQEYKKEFLYIIAYGKNYASV